MALARLRSAGCASDACPYADRRSDRVARQMPFLFRFAGPEAVLVIVACELLAGNMYGAVGAQPVGLRFSTGAGLWTFCLRWEEQFRVPTAVGRITPVV